MIVKSETNGCGICNIFKKFWKDLKKDEPYAIVVSISAIFIIATIIFGSVILIDTMSKSSKYNEIVATQPILKCDNSEEVTNKNYQVLLIDSTPVIKVYYSNTKIKSYKLSECLIIEAVTNAELGTNNVLATNTSLKVRIETLTRIIATRESQIKKLKETNSQIKTDYKLPTQKQLEVLYVKFKKTKGKDIKQYLNGLHKEERKKLAEARVENPNIVESIPCDKDDQACLDLEYDVWQ